jgi:lipid II:glycine glycyltransferase (peptidoglycan interpeptide bridge formation enzyme)
VGVSLDVVWASSLSAADGEDYDRFVAESAAGHYAQTRAWARVALETRPSVLRYFLARDEGTVIGAALVLRAALGPLPLPFATVERGPVVRRPDDIARVASAMASTARARGVIQLTVMPYWTAENASTATRGLLHAGFHDAQRPEGAHAETLRIDLEATTMDALLGPGQERLRRRLAQATRAGAVARRGTRADFERHRFLTAQMMQAQRRGTRSAAHDDALWTEMLADGTRGALFICEHQGRTVATVVVLRHGDVAVYAQGAMTPEPSKISKSVPPLLAAIAWARDEGCRVFDLGGIPTAEDTDDKRRRIAHLKLDFAQAPVRLVRQHARLF